MKNIIVILILVAISMNTANAQKRGRGKERVQALKVAIFTEELDLTAKEAEIFWPLYNEYDKKQRKIVHELRKLHKAGMTENSDKKLESILEKRFKLQEQKLKLERTYYKKFKKILPIKKVVRISHAERKFKLVLLKKRKGKGKKRRREGR